MIASLSEVVGRERADTQSKNLTFPEIFAAIRRILPHRAR
jgi:hypothetical protein